MKAWTAPDGAYLLQLENDLGCGALSDGDVFVLLCGARHVEAVWQDDVWRDEDCESALHFEVEDEELVGVMETRFDDGRTNYSREVELEDLSPIPAQRVIGEERLKDLLRRHLNDVNGRPQES